MCRGPERGDSLDGRHLRFGHIFVGERVRVCTCGVLAFVSERKENVPVRWAIFLGGECTRVFARVSVLR